MGTYPCSGLAWHERRRPAIGTASTNDGRIDGDVGPVLAAKMMTSRRMSATQDKGLPNIGPTYALRRLIRRCVPVPDLAARRGGSVVVEDDGDGRLEGLAAG